jgi:DNA-binding NarL/FixJ family response regulator
VFLVDDHEVVRRGLTDLFSESGGITVVGEASGATSALARIPAARPDVAVLDVRLPDGDGVGVCRELRRLLPDLSVVMLSAYDDADARAESTVAGASGFLLKAADGRELLDAVGLVAAGGTLIDPAEAAAARADRRDGRDHIEARLAPLTAQELRVFTLLGEGLSNRQIGGRLHVTEKTVKNHVTRLLRKLGMSGRTEAAVLAAKRRSLLR